MRRGGWRPAAWDTHWDQGFILGVVYAASWIRCIDYATGDDHTNRTTIVAEVLMPLDVWAVALFVGNIVLGIGWAQRRHIFVFAGHVILGTLYMSLACGLMSTYVGALADWFGDIAGDFLWTFGLWRYKPVYDPWQLDGIRHAGPLFTIALIHWLTAIRTGVEPIPRGKEDPEVVISGPVNGGQP